MDEKIELVQIYFIENERILLNYLIIEKTRIVPEEDLKYKESR